MSKNKHTNYEDNKLSIKFYVKQYILTHAAEIKNKTVVDFPAGNGITSRLIESVGGKAKPFDIFPEYFTQQGMRCEKADIHIGIPMDSLSVDMLICQEGIEHFSDQINALKEFNRVLKSNGTLLITTPNYSNLRARLSYLLSESERFNSTMPPNEIDSVWMSSNAADNDIYYGHIFLIGIQKLRVLAKLSGFRIKRIYKTRLKTTSLLLFPLWYPFIVLSNLIAYRKANRKATSSKAKATYREIVSLGIHPVILLYGHLMIEFEKEAEVIDVKKMLVSKHTEFGIT